MDYRGTLLLVSHDRSFINHIVDSCFVFEGAATVNEYVGGYDDWVRQRPEIKNSAEKNTGVKKSGIQGRKLAGKSGFKQQKELKALPAKIEKLEQAITELQQKLAAPDFYQQEEGIISETRQMLAENEQSLAKLFQRWEELESGL